MPDIHEPLLVNTIGHSAGAVIFGIFLILFLQDRAGSGFLRGSWLSFAAAVLAFLWDTISLAALVVEPSSHRDAAIAVALSFAVLSLLPAVLLHLSLDRNLRGLVAVGYLLGVTSAGSHLFELFRPDQHVKQFALVLIPLGFGVLTAIAVGFLLLRRMPGTRSNASRIAGSMCLFLFAVSFVHFGSASPDHTWSSELIIHHAGIPIALFVLLQDYRFVLLDAFVRFLANVMLAGLMLSVLLNFSAVRNGLRLALVDPSAARHPLYEALMLTAVCLLLIGFALLRNRVQRLLTIVLFRRPAVHRALETMRSRPELHEDEAGYLDWAVEQMSEFVYAARAEIATSKSGAEELGKLKLLLPMLTAESSFLRSNAELRWVDAVVPLRLSHGDVRYILLGRREGGRRYLSEDLEFLNRISSAVAEQVERFRSSEVQRLVSQAELRALQSQINPHFLFNALNTLYGIIPRDASGARRTVLNLADIFRYFLQNDKTFIPLGEELQIVKAYLEIEGLRFGSRLRVEIDVDEMALTVPIPVLSIQPLVENAVKHGIASKPEKGWLRLKVSMREQRMSISVEDSGSGIGKGESGGAGVGLANVTRRLELCYGSEASFQFASNSFGTKVEFSIPIAKLAPAH